MTRANSYNNEQLLVNLRTLSLKNKWGAKNKHAPNKKEARIEIFNERVRP